MKRDTIGTLRARIAELEAGHQIDRQRLWDLVRLERHALFESDAITPEEFALLVQDHPAVARLESYDEVRLSLTTAAAALKGKADEIAKLEAGVVDLARVITLIGAERDALQAEVNGLRSEEWCCVVCRARFGERLKSGTVAQSNVPDSERASVRETQESGGA